MAKSNKGTAETRTLTGAERHSRAQSRLAEARQQLADLEQQLADDSRQLETLATMEASAIKGVEKAESQADAAAAEVVETHSTLLVVEGSEEETAAKQRHAEAQQAHTAARHALDEVRSTLATVRERSQSERFAVGARMDAAKAQRRDVTRLVQSLERAVSEAHEQAGRELLDELTARHGELVSLCDQARVAADTADRALRDNRAEAASQLTPWPERLADAREQGVAPNGRDAYVVIFATFARFLDALEQGQPVMGEPPYVTEQQTGAVTTACDALHLSTDALNVLLYGRDRATDILTRARQRLRVVTGAEAPTPDPAQLLALRNLRQHYDERGNPVSATAKMGIRPF